MADKKVKYTVTFSEKISITIDELAEKGDVSKPEVFRRALALYHYLNEANDNGGKIQIIGAHGEVKEIVFQ